MEDDNDIIKLLRTFAQRHDPDRVFDAEQALQPFGEDAIPALAEALGDFDADLRLLALRLLAHLNGDTEPALPAMIQALEDPNNRNVRLAALAPVAKLGLGAIDAIPILETWIGSDDEFSHVSAAGHILMIDPTKSEELLPILVESLESDDFSIRCQTAWLLGQLGELAEEAVPALKRMLDDDDSSVQRVALNALQEITGDESDAVKNRN